MKVNIYLETDKQTQEYTWRKYGYVLEAMCGRRPPVTRVGFGSVEGTYHKCNLQALAGKPESRGEKPLLQTC